MIPDSNPAARRGAQTRGMITGENIDPDVVMNCPFRLAEKPCRRMSVGGLPLPVASGMIAATEIKAAA
jgi:hypothetical protein